MPEHKRKKRSRSRSREDHYVKRRNEGKIEQLQKEVNNLTKVVETLVSLQKEKIPLSPSPKRNKHDKQSIGKQKFI